MDLKPEAAALQNVRPRRVLSDTGSSYTVELSTEQWAALPDHPRQRDTQRQASKAHWTQARVAQGPALEALRSVVAAELEGRIYKVQGHTRGLLWTTGKLPDPGTVFATIYRCRNREELNNLRATFDTQSAAETMFDRVSGAYREQHLTLTSKRLRNGTIVDALSIAMRGFARGDDTSSKEDFDVYEAVRVFAPELRLLDTVDPQPETFHTGIVAAALLSLALDPSTLEFFDRLSRAQGSKKDGLLDPIEGTLWIINRIKRQRSGWLKSRQEQLCSTTLVAVRLWKAGESAPGFWSPTGKYEPIPLSDVVQQVRELKESARG